MRSRGIVRILLGVLVATAELTVLTDLPKPPASAAVTASWSVAAQLAPPVEQLSGVSCPSTKDCEAVGVYGNSVEGAGGAWSGAIIHTTDGGATWSDQLEPGDYYNVEFTSISCASATVCQVIGAGPDAAYQILGTTDGGVTWSTELLSSGVFGLDTISCATIRNCVAAGAEYESGLPTQVFLVTTDGGTSWTTVPLGTTADVGSISCPSAQMCVAVGAEPANHGLILTTSDGGATWTPHTFEPGVEFSDVSCSSATTCEVTGINDVAGAEAIWGTTDGGEEWASQAVPNTAGFAPAISCASTTTCVAIGSSGSGLSVVTTTNGGVTWLPQAPPTLSGAIPNPFIDCASVTSCVGAGGSALFGSIDGGSTWSSQPPPFGTSQLTAGTCPSTVECYALGWGFTGRSTAPVPIVVNSNDGGSTWAAASLPADMAGVLAIACGSPLQCVVTGAGPSFAGAPGAPVVASTTDGSTWSSDPLPTGTPQMSSVACPSVDVCHAVGWEDQDIGTVWVTLGTTDGGASWTTEVERVVNGGVDQISCPSVTTCYAMGGNEDAVETTTDGGATWTSGPVLNVEGYGGPSCPTPTECMASSTQGLFVTTDSGSDWTPAATGTGFGSLACPDTVQCAGVSDLGSLEVTDDFGNTWSPQTTPPGAANLVSVTCTSTASCIAFGADTLGGAVIVSGTLPPAILTVVDNFGPNGGGNTVMLTGVNFSGTTTVDFGSVASASFWIGSPSEITAVVPPTQSPPGTSSTSVDVTVSTPAGTSNGVTYTYYGEPSVSAIAPDAGGVGGGTWVVITGAGFAPNSVVAFGGVGATSTTQSPEEIDAVAPPGMLGTVNVTVTTFGVTSTESADDQFTYVDLPTVTSVYPSFGPESGGETVTLSGTNMEGVTAVNFGATSAPSFTVINGATVVAEVPPGTGTVEVTVSPPCGAQGGVPFTYLPIPVVTGVSPSMGPWEGGTQLTVVGQNFPISPSVDIGWAPAIVTSASPTMIVADTSRHSAGIEPVIVFSLDLSSGATSSSRFSYLGPRLSAVTPATGRPGITVRLRGANLTGITGVLFGSTLATALRVTGPGSATVVVPRGTGRKELTLRYLDAFAHTKRVFTYLR